MKIAIASQNRRSVTAHVGRCRHFFIFDMDQAPTQSPGSLDLGPEQVLHVWQDGAHPLDGVSTVIAGSIGQGVADKLAHRGIHVLATPERDLGRVVDQFLDGTLPIMPIREEIEGKDRPGECLHPETVGNLIFGRSPASMTRKG